MSQMYDKTITGQNYPEEGTCGTAIGVSLALANDFLLFS